MLDAATIAIVKTTAPVVAQHAEAITRCFYQRMFTGDPQVQAFFNQAHQHSGGQQKALAGAICAYAANIDNLGALGGTVELIAQKHCSLGIKPEHYPIVGKHLLVAIKEVLGDAATDEIIDAWGKAYGLLADIFIAREKEIYAQQAATPGGWNGYRPLRVAKKVVENPIITSFYLEAEDGKPLPTFQPGQYLTVKIDHPSKPTSPRNYSLSDRPGVSHYRISVKREPAPIPEAPGGLISNHLHDNIQQGDTILVGPPCGEFTLDPTRPSDDPVVLLSGGIGLTPLLSMLKSLAHHRATRPVYFLHASRNSQTHAMAQEIAQAGQELANFTSHVCYSNPLDDDASQGQCHSTGFLNDEKLQRLLPSGEAAQHADYYFCGPAPFMQGVYRHLKTRNVDDSRIHFEFFGPRGDITAAAAAAPAQA